MPPTAALTTTVGAHRRKRSAIARRDRFEQRRIFENPKLLNEAIAVTAGAQTEVAFEQRAARRERRGRSSSGRSCA